MLREPTDTESTGTSSAPDRDLTQERSPSQSAIGHEIADSKVSAQNFMMPLGLQETKLSDLPTPSKGDHSFPWPVIQALLQCNSINLSQWDGGTQSVEKWLVDISQDFDAPLLRGSPTDIHYDDNAMLNLKPGQPITLNRGYVEAICSIYFETFHCTYPILDRSHLKGVREVVYSPGVGGVQCKIFNDEKLWHVSNVECGDVILFSSQTVHRAEPNISESRVRVSVDTRFCDYGSPVFSTNLEPHHGWRIEHLNWEYMYRNWNDESLMS